MLFAYVMGVLLLYSVVQGLVVVGALCWMELFDTGHRWEK